MPYCHISLRPRAYLLLVLSIDVLMPSNRRLQSDAASRPQDQADFDTLIWLESHLDLMVRRG